MTSPRRTPVVSWLALLLALAATANASGPADGLLRLAPPDAGATLAVENLRERTRDFLESPITRALRKLPRVREWVGAEQGAAFRKALRKAEDVLGVDAVTIRDELLGQAFILALHIPPGGTPDEARGLLLIQVPDQPILDRLTAGLAAAEGRGGDRARFSTREHLGRSYRVREYAAADRPAEYYATLDGRIFAWSNSETLIEQAIERQVKSDEGLSGVAEFKTVRGRLSEHALASLYVDPRFVARLMESSRSRPPGEERLAALIGRYLGALRYAGASIEWRSGPVIQTEELVDPDRLDDDFRRWAGRTEPVDPALRRFPSTTLAAACLSLDLGVVYNAVMGLDPENTAVRLDNLRVGLKGILLGLEPEAVLSHIGPGVVVSLDRPDPTAPGAGTPILVKVSLGSDAAKYGPAVDNALRTILAANALDPKHNDRPVRLQSTTAAGATITSLEPDTPYAFSVHGDTLVVGTSVPAVARALAAQDDPASAARYESARKLTAPGATNYAVADLRAISSLLTAHRPAAAMYLARRQNRDHNEVAAELNRLVDVMDLFDCLYVSSQAEPKFTAVHRSLGLVKLPTPTP